MDEIYFVIFADGWKFHYKMQGIKGTSIDKKPKLY